MSTVLNFYLPEYEGIEEAREVPNSKETHPDSFVLEAAKYFHHGEDGWEVGWPVVIAVVCNGVEIGRYEIVRECEPVFYISHRRNVKEDASASTPKGGS